MLKETPMGKVKTYYEKIIENLELKLRISEQNHFEIQAKLNNEVAKDYELLEKTKRINNLLELIYDLEEELSKYKRNNK